MNTQMDHRLQQDDIKLTQDNGVMEVSVEYVVIIIPQLHYIEYEKQKEGNSSKGEGEEVEEKEEANGKQHQNCQRK